MRIPAFVLLACSMFAADLSTQDRQAVIERVRAYSVAYSRGLQDFTCLRTTVRSMDSSGAGGRWKELDTQVQELTYANGKESYRTLRQSGTRAAADVTIKGEFSGLAHIFDPRGRVDVQFESAEGPTCVVRYQAPLDSGLALPFRSGQTQYTLPHHGMIVADCATGAVTRLQVETEALPKMKDGVTADVYYAPVAIGGREFLLPMRALDVTHVGKVLTRAEVTFTSYRKYDAASAIRFDGDN